MFGTQPQKEDLHQSSSDVSETSSSENNSQDSDFDKNCSLFTEDISKLESDEESFKFSGDEQQSPRQPSVSKLTRTDIVQLPNNISEQKEKK